MEPRGSSVKQDQTLWQVAVLFFVFMFALGVLALVAVGIIRMAQRGAPVTITASPTQTGEALEMTGEVLQIVVPLDGALYRGTEPIPVSAVLARVGALRAELEVDGRSVAVVANPQPQTSLWLIEFAWEGTSEGSHNLVVRAFGGEGELAVSTPVVVKVVLSGQLVFASNREGGYAIYTIQTDGRGLARLIPGSGPARQPAQRVDGALAWVAKGEGGQDLLRYVAEVADTAEIADLFAGQDPAWAPDGTRLAYAATVSDVTQVFAADAITSSQVTREGAYAGQPTWAPDGTRLAYVAERDRNWDIWVADLDGGDPQRLTDDPGQDWAPAWSPDGDQIAFVSNRGGSYQIYVIKADGTGVRVLTDLTQGAESPCWSPDGYWLAFVAYTGDGTGVNARELYLMRADGRDQVRLTYDSFDDTEPDWVWLP
jgi:hypothetical protein